MKNLQGFFIMSTYSKTKSLWALKENCFKFHRRLVHNCEIIQFSPSSSTLSFLSSSNNKNATFKTSENFPDNNFNQSKIFKAHRYYSPSSAPACFSSSSPLLSIRTPTVLLQIRSISSQVNRQFNSSRDQEEEHSNKNDGNQLVNYSSTSNNALYMDDNENDIELEELVKEDIWNVAPITRASSTFGPFANDSEVIKNLVRMGVKVHQWETKYGIPEFILKLDFKKDVAPYVKFLVNNGVDPDRLGYFFLTKNPFIFKEDLANLEIRLKYLRSKKFDEEAITRIINCNPFWLSFSVQRIDRRLGFFQEYFQLTGNQVRELAKTGPKLITGNLGHVKDVTFKVKECMGFEPNEIVKLLLARPRIFQEDKDELWNIFDYIHNEVKFSHDQILRNPNILLCRVSRLRSRIGFLQTVGRAQFNPEKPNYVSFSDILEKDDATFAMNVAKSSSQKYNEYLKSF